MSMMSWIGKKIDGLYKKAMDKESRVKAFVIAFIGGFVDGVMAFWAIFGVTSTILLPVGWLLNKLKKEK